MGAHMTVQQGFYFGGSFSCSGGLVSNSLLLIFKSLGVNSSFVVTLLFLKAFTSCFSLAADYRSTI